MPSCLATSAKFPLAQAELGRQWKSNPTQPSLRADGTPCTYLAVVGGQGVCRGLAARRGDGGDGRCGRGRRDEDLGLEVGRRIGLDLHLRPARGRRHGLLLLTRRLDGWTVIDV